MLLIFVPSQESLELGLLIQRPQQIARALADKYITLHYYIEVFHGELYRNNKRLTVLCSQNDVPVTTLLLCVLDSTLKLPIHL